VDDYMPTAENADLVDDLVEYWHTKGWDLQNDAVRLIEKIRADERARAARKIRLLLLGAESTRG